LLEALGALEATAFAPLGPSGTLGARAPWERAGGVAGGAHPTTGAIQRRARKDRRKDSESMVEEKRLGGRLPFLGGSRTSGAAGLRRALRATLAPPGRSRSFVRSLS
jgi:hypothetical protein